MTRAAEGPTRNLVVGSEPDFPPLALGQNEATAGGFTVELWKAVAQEQGLGYTLRVRPFAQLLEEFKRGEIDVLINLAQSDARREFADFTVPHVIIHGAVFVRRDESRIESEADLAGRQIIVINADLAHDYAIGRGWQRQLVPVATAEEGFRLLAAGQHDALLMSKLVGMRTLAQAGIKGIRVLPGQAGFHQKFSFAVRKGEAGLLARLNEGLAVSKSTGRYDALYEQWLGVYDPKLLTLWDVFKIGVPLLAGLVAWQAYFLHRSRLNRQRWAAAVALQRSQEHLQAIINSVEGIVWEADAATFRFTFVSPQAERLLGYPVSQWLTELRFWVNHLHPDDREEAVRFCIKATRERRNHEFEYRMVAADGRVIWLRDLVTVAVENEQLTRLRGIMVDITARKAAEVAAAEHQRRLATLLGNLPGYAYRVANDRDYTPEFLSEGVVRVTGYTASEYLVDRTITCGSEVLPEDRDAVWRVVQRALAAREPYELEYRLRTKSGAVKWVWERGRGVHDERGALVALEGFVSDITARKEAERRFAAFAALGHRLNTVRTAAEAGEIIVAAADALFAWDGCSLLLYSPERDRVRPVLCKDVVAGRRCDCLESTEEVAPGVRTRRVLERGPELTLRREPVTMAEDSIPFGDTARPSASLMHVPVHDGERITAILSIQSYRLDAYTEADLQTLQQLADHCGGALHRIAEEESRLRAEAALEESRQMQERAQQIGHIGSWVSDPSPTGRLNWSAESMRIFGFAPGEFDGRVETFFALVHPEDRDAVARASRAALAGTRAYDLQHRIVRRDGQVRWVHEQADVERDDAGQPVRMVGVVQDITERRQLEEQLRHAQRMDAMGQLAGGVAHDFNNLLSSIIGNTELAMLYAPGSREAGESLEAVLAASRRARDLVRQILAFSRRQEQQREPMQLHQVVREALGLLRASVPASVEFRSNVAVAPSILADASEMHQVVMNLCTNAWHALPGGAGVLQVELAEAEVGEALARQQPDLRPGRYVRLTVADNGCGMDEATLARIFEPFFTTKPMGEGTGLGLAVVHGIVKSHDGGILVHSEPGRGTTFALYFPVFEAEVVEPPAEPPAEPQPVPRGQGEHILFVDDEAPLARMGRAALERLGYRVTAATSPAEALAVFSADPARFDLVITDLNMPGLNGTELARRLAAVRPDLRLVLTTGNSAVVTRDSVFAQGFRELLPKPYDLRSLAETIHRALNGTNLTRRP